MPSSWTPSLRLEQQFTGENINLWGEKLNVALAHADYAVAGWLTKPLIGDVSLTSANGAADEARAAMIKFTGGAGPFKVTVPGVSKSYLIWNATGGIVTLTTGAGASVAIDPGDMVAAVCDGAQVRTPGYGGLPLKDYIAAAALGATGSLPATAGNAGKYLFSDGVNAFWKQAQFAEIGDLEAEVRRRALVFSLIF